MALVHISSTKDDFDTAKLRNELEVSKFLEKNPSLIELLPEIYSKIKDYFPDGQLFLEVISDSEESNASRLVISLYPVGDAPDILNKFSQLKDDWWSDTYDRIDGKISINIEHKDLITSGDPWSALESLIGTIEGPEDWALEHDHYIYGTPKRYQS
jgi:hypothetical protein